MAVLLDMFLPWNCFGISGAAPKWVGYVMALVDVCKRHAGEWWAVLLGAGQADQSQSVYRRVSTKSVL